jgi:hypothetical protein
MFNIDDVADGLTSGLEYSPPLGMFYVGSAAMSLLFWYVAPGMSRFIDWPLIFVTGGITLLMKGLLYFRKESDGVLPSLQDAMMLPQPVQNTKTAVISHEDEPLVVQVALFMKTFGLGFILLFPASIVFLIILPKLPSGDVNIAFLLQGTMWLVGWYLVTKYKGSNF